MIYFLCRKCCNKDAIETIYLIANTDKSLVCTACGDADEQLQTSGYQEMEVVRERVALRASSFK